MCIVTLIRLILSVQIKLDSYSRDLLKISIVTILEPLLGIIVACLPIFPPAIKKITARSEESYVLSSAVARLRLKRSKSSASKNCDDSFPLTELEEKRTRNHITGPSGKPDDVSGSHGRFDGVEIPPQSSIRIEQDWEVRSDQARDLEGNV